MARRIFVLLIVGLLAFGGSGPAAFGVAAECASQAAVFGSCPDCGDLGDRDQRKCPAAACPSICAASPAATALLGAEFPAYATAGRARLIPPSALAATRAIPPDLPPPR